MTDQGLSFSLAAYPSPDHFRFFHLGNRTSGNGSEVSSGRFSSLCLQNALTLSTVNCTITPVDVPKALLGFYRAIVSNDLGIVNITFSVDKEGNGLWMYSGSLHRFSEATDRFGLNVQRKSHIKAKHKLQNYEYNSVSFFMSQATSGFESVKKLCTE